MRPALEMRACCGPFAIEDRGICATRRCILQVVHRPAAKASHMTCVDVGRDSTERGFVMSISGLAAMDLENGDSFENSIRDVAVRNVTYLHHENSIEGEIAATTISNLIRRASGSTPGGD